MYGSVTVSRVSSSYHHTRLTSVTPNTHGMSGIRASTGRTPNNIPPSTTVLRHSLPVFLDTTPPRFPRSTSVYHSCHIHPCAFLHPIVLFLPLNMPKPSQPCFLDLVLDTFNAQMAQELIASYPLKTHHTSFVPSSSQPLINLTRSPAFIAQV